MSRISFILLTAAAAIALSGCAGMPLNNAGGSGIMEALQVIASDPKCGHIDRIQGNVGGLGGNNLSVYLERTCAPQPTSAQESDAVAVDPLLDPG